MIKRNKLFAMLSLIACAVLCSIIAVISAFAPTIAVDAYTTSSSGYTATKPEDEIYDDTKDIFSYANLQALLEKLISGSTAGATLDQAVENVRTGLAVNNGTTPTALASQNIIVRFGGIDWLVVAASTPMEDGSSASGNQPESNDVIITLWQAVGTETAQWNLGDSDLTSDSYPSTMYGTSYMRSQVLGNGGQYWQSTSQLQGDGTQPTSSAYYKFANKSGILQKYLVAPAHISWQKVQISRTKFNTTHDGPNDSWGTNIGAWYYSGGGYNYNYESKPGYSAWKDDLVWLPSWTETGNYGNYQGLWNTSTANRENTERIWLRTCYYDLYRPPARYIKYLLASGQADTHASEASSELLVRPALHLNLTAAAQAAGRPVGEMPTVEASEETVIYSGQEYEFDLNIGELATNRRVSFDIVSEKGAESRVEDGIFYAKNAGTYTVSVKPAGGNWWGDPDAYDENNPPPEEEKDRTPVELFKLTIEKRRVGIDIKSLSVTYGNPFTLSSAAEYWEYSADSPYEFAEGEEEYLTVFSPATEQSPLNVGKYPLYFEFASENETLQNNYEITYHGDFEAEGEYAEFSGIAGTVTVLPAELDVEGMDEVTFTNDTYTYDGTSKSITVNGAPAGVDYTVEYYKGGVLDLEHKTAGDYQVIITFTKTGDEHGNFVTIREWTMTIAKATASVTPIHETPDIIYTSGKLPDLDFTATFGDAPVSGTIRWDNSAPTVIGETAVYGWTWTPDDTENFNVITGTATFHVEKVKVVEYTVTFNANGRKFYDTDPLNDLKDYLTVYVRFNDGAEKTLAKGEYSLLCEGGNQLIFGSVNITVTYVFDGAPNTDSFALDVSNLLYEKKEEAKDEIDRAAQEKKDEIDKRDDLTPEEKEDAKKKVDEEAQRAKDAIDQASSLEGVSGVLEKSLEAVDDAGSPSSPHEIGGLVVILGIEAVTVLALGAAIGIVKKKKGL